MSMDASQSPLLIELFALHTGIPPWPDSQSSEHSELCDCVTLGRLTITRML